MGKEQIFPLTSYLYSRIRLFFYYYYYLGCSEALHVEVTRVKRLQKQILLHAHGLKDVKVIPKSLKKQSLIRCFKLINNSILCGEFLVLCDGSWEII